MGMVKTVASKYLHITDTGEYVEYDEIPVSHKNMSNFHLLPMEDLWTHGFFRLEITEPSYDASKQYLAFDRYTKDETRNVYIKKMKIVTPPYNVENKDKTPEQKRLDVLMLRYEKLNVCDWVDLPSARAKLTVTERKQWDDYREALRVATDVENPDDVVWPTAPWSPMFGRGYNPGVI